MADWFALYTSAGRESDADRHLKGAGFRTFFPHRTEWVPNKRGTLDLRRFAWFSRYLFLEAEHERLPNAVDEEARRLHGVVRFVSVPGCEPFPIPMRFMVKLMAKADPLGCMHVKERPGPREEFPGKEGDQIVVKEGHYLWNFRAVVKEVSGEDLLIELEVPMLGRKEATIQARFAQVLGDENAA